MFHYNTVRPKVILNKAKLESLVFYFQASPSPFIKTQLLHFIFHQLIIISAEKHNFRILNI